MHSAMLCWCPVNEGCLLREPEAGVREEEHHCIQNTEALEYAIQCAVTLIQGLLMQQRELTITIVDSLENRLCFNRPYINVVLRVGFKLLTEKAEQETSTWKKQGKRNNQPS